MTERMTKQTTQKNRTDKTYRGLKMRGLPEKQGLYDPRNEHDACGIGFIAHIKNVKSHDIVSDGLKILDNLEHRGAVGADPKAGDGVGILLQTPDAFFRKVTSQENITLPEEGQYAAGVFFLPPDDAARQTIEALAEKIIVEEGHAALGWRLVPVDNSDLGNRFSQPSLSPSKFLLPTPKPTVTVLVLSGICLLSAVG